MLIWYYTDLVDALADSSKAVLEPETFNAFRSLLKSALFHALLCCDYSRRMFEYLPAHYH